MQSGMRVMVSVYSDLVANITLEVALTFTTSLLQHTKTSIIVMLNGVQKRIFVSVVGLEKVCIRY